MALQVVGVRHHSPACARLVEDVIHRVRPRFVLVEGPSDMNERMDELLLPHELPIALFTYRQAVGGASRGNWAPFCDYSPEWVALRAARDVGATPLFIDLPAWHGAFAGYENRFADRHVRHSDRLDELCATLGFEDTDALWDHLFEQPQECDRLSDRLASYFEQLRGDEHPGARDGPREDFMRSYVAWAMGAAAGGDVVVVCGGYHKPVLERPWEGAPPERPVADAPGDGARVGSYLVPFSFRRLDSFAGYASGMPSPAFYQTVWEHGHERAAELMLGTTIRHLRGKRQQVSASDAIAASTLAHGLRALRGHDALARIDVLDGLAGALVKDALESSLPWTRRGTLRPGTDPLLVEIVAAFSGQRIGTLAKGTPQPPLVHDAFSELARVALPMTHVATRVKLAVTTEIGARQSEVLHRLRVLGIPGFELVRGPSLARTNTDLTEEWSLARLLETDTALIEAALYGATLDAAASAKLEALSGEAANIRDLADVIFDAALCGIGALTERCLAGIARLVATEPSFDALGGALTRLLSLRRGDVLLGSRSQIVLDEVLAACFDRGLWLFEGIQGAAAPLDMGHLRAVRALRDLMRIERHSLDVGATRARELCERRARDADAPAALRGAALGVLWSTREPRDDDGTDERRASTIVRSVARPTLVGDFLGGLFALAREEVVRAHELLATVDDLIAGFTRDDFMFALPALRQAFIFFPPRERLGIAESILRLGDGRGTDPMHLLGATVDVAVVRRGAAVDRAAAALAARYGLTDSLDAELAS